LGPSLTTHHAPRDVIAPGQVIQSVELRLCFFRALPKDFNARFGSDGYVAFIEIYAAAGCVLETLGIFKRLLVSAELSLSTFKDVGVDSFIRPTMEIMPRP
jgi:hypothetical protein